LTRHERGRFRVRVSTGSAQGPSDIDALAGEMEKKIQPNTDSPQDMIERMKIL